MGVAVRLPPELKAKLAPLLRLQGSSNDGERAMRAPPLLGC